MPPPGGPLRGFFCPRFILNQAGTPGQIVNKADEVSILPLLILCYDGEFGRFGTLKNNERRVMQTRNELFHPDNCRFS